MKKLSDNDVDNICQLYKEGYSIEKISKKYAIGDRRTKQILINANIEISNSHKKTKSEDTYIEDNQKRFPIINGKHYVAVLKSDNNVCFNDYLNKSGTLINYIKNELSIEIPSLYKRKKYFSDNNKQWYEQWFNVILIDDNKLNVKKCPYCEWSTIDTENKSGMFLTHLNKCHDISIEQYLQEYPEDEYYFKAQANKIKHNIKLDEPENSIICPICNEKLEKLTYWHLKYRHNLTFNEFREKYPNSPLLSNNMKEQIGEALKSCNMTVSKNRFISKYEREIQEFLKDNNVNFECNRQYLLGKEIDILIEDKKIGIEFDGLKFHTEFFGKKTHSYHLDKTEGLNKLGYGLIHIFEDEYVNHKDIVYSKIRHILNLDDKNLPKAYGRKCEVKEIYKSEAQEFLNKYHIQGYSSSTVYLGAYFNNILVAVMTFKHGSLLNKGWELSRFATDYHYNCCGIGGKLFKYFLRKYNPNLVFSFADRRWTTNINSNLYTKLGFDLDKIGAPDYSYYNDRVNKYKRIHKMSFNKKKLSKKYGFPLTMTEIEMAKELGYDRIWNCGLVKYVWNNKW